MSTPDPDHHDAGPIWRILNGIPDPEIPVVSVVEMGMIADIRVDDDGVRIAMTPTFAACPAIDHMRKHMLNAVSNAGYRNVRVDIVFDPPWNTDRITPEGLEKLRQFGLAIPQRMDGRSVEPRDLHGVRCPYCDATDTTLESPFGPTLCRSIHYCNACLQSFEHFKPLSC